MDKKKEFERLKKESYVIIAKEIPRAISVLFVLVISCSLYFMFQWKILIVPIAVCVTYYLVGFLFIIVISWAMKKAQKKIKSEDDLDF